MNEGIISVKTQTAINEISAGSVRVYPNLIDKYCFVELSEISGKVTMEVFNLSGEKETTYTDKSASDQIKLDLSKLRTGVHFLRITNSTSSFTVKLIKK